MLQIDKSAVDLSRFDRSIDQEPWGDEGKSGRSSSLLILPKKRFGVPLSVFLPDDEKSAKKVRAALIAQVPLDPNSSCRGVLRVIDTLVRWTRL